MELDEIKKIAVAAREHANNLKADISNTMHRIEHVRITRLAIEADTIATALEEVLKDV